MPFGTKTGKTSRRIKVNETIGSRKRGVTKNAFLIPVLPVVQIAPHLISFPIYNHLLIFTSTLNFPATGLSEASAPNPRTFANLDKVILLY